MTRAVRWALFVALAGSVVTACSHADEATLASPSPTARLPTTLPVASPTASATTVTTSPPAAPDPCEASSLTVEEGEGRAALGRGLYVFELRNTSSRSCRLLGYPAVAVLDAQGRVLAEAQPAGGQLLPDRGPSAVVLGPGASGYFGIESANVCNGGARPSGSDSIRVVPPGQAGTLTVEATITICPGQGIVTSPVRASEDDLTR